MHELLQKCEEVIIELSKFHDDLLYLGESINDNRIELFEKEIGFLLPEDFKYLIRRHNGLSLSGTEIKGIDSANGESALSQLYKFEHYEVGNPMPVELLPFSADGMGNHYCFNLSEMKDGSCPVVFWQHDFEYDNSNEVEICNDNIIAWIKEVMIEWTLEDYNYDGTSK
jgi:cell wall assembly regulator SMI1